MNILMHKPLTEAQTLSHTRSSRTSVQGALIASAAVISATLLTAYAQPGGISLDSISTAQRTNAALWLLDLMPFAFAFWGQYVSNLVTREEAMYVNRTENNEITSYSPDFEQSRLTELTMKAELMHAISEGHLVLHYQPKIDREFRVYEAEALIRWHHPEKGLVPPDQFVPLVERNGLNRELLLWVLGNAIAQQAIWQRQGIDIGVCINLTTLDLIDHELPRMLADVLRRTNVSPSRIKLELTETMVMADHHRAMEVLSAITELGIHTSIDDFGTGCASLSCLHQLPSQELKIDKTFVTDMVGNERNMVIVQTIIDLAHNLSMSVVAEGVESEDALHRLLDFGCDAMQGYHISRPMEASQLGPWLHSWDKQHGLTHQAELDLAV